MKTAQDRDDMVARVHAAVGQWPNLDAMPVGAKAPEGAEIVAVRVVGNPADNSNYVRALYELSASGATPIGRTKDATEIMGAKRK